MSGLDTSDGLSQSTAWKHSPGDSNVSGIPSKTVIRAGDLIKFKGGAVYQGSLSLVFDGTETQPVIYDGNSDGAWGSGKAVIDGENTDKVAVDIAANFVRFSGFEIRNWGAQGIRLEAMNFNTNVAKGNNVVISSNVIHHIGTNHPLGTGNSAFGKGIQVRYSRDLLIEYNEIYQTNYDAITLSPSGNTVIRNNIFHDGYVDGIKGGANDGTLIIEGNSFYGFRQPAVHSDCLQFLGNRGTTIIRNNYATNCGQYFFIEPYASPPNSYTNGPIYVYNNVLKVPTLEDFGSAGVSFDMYVNVQSVYVIGNTFINFDDGSGAFGIGNRYGSFGVSSRVLNEVVVQNNLFYRSYSGLNLNDSGGFPLIDQQKLSYGHNVYFTKYKKDGLENTIPPLDDPATSFVADPKFVDFSNNNFSLASDSPLLNKGAAVSDVGGISFAFDKNGVGRPQGSGWDVGALETCLSRNCIAPPLPPTPSIPNPPTNLSSNALATKVSLDWIAPTNMSVDGYRIYRDNELLKTQTGNTYVDSSVQSLMTYVYDVIAYKGSVSSSKASIRVTTPASDSVTLASSNKPGEEGFSQFPNILNLSKEEKMNILLNLKDSRDVVLKIYTRKGEKIDELHNNGQPFVVWDVKQKEIAAGVYILSLDLGNGIQTKKVIVVK